MGVYADKLKRPFDFLVAAVAVAVLSPDALETYDHSA